MSWRSILCVSLLLASGVASAQLKSVGTLGNDYSRMRYSFPWHVYNTTAFNNKGQLIGQSGYETDPGWSENRAFLYDGNTIRDISLPDTSYSYAVDLNQAGQVAGFALPLDGTNDRATLYDGAQTINLGTLPGGTWSYATRINALGHVGGQSEADVDGVLKVHAFVYANGLLQDLGTFGGDTSTLSDLNDLGQATGSAQTPDGSFRAFLWSGGTLKDLGILGGFVNSYGQRMNSSGQVAGICESFDSTYSYRAFLHNGVQMIDLGTLGGVNSFVRDMNNAGQVIGRSEIDNGETHAFFYDPKVGKMVRIDPPHAFSATALDINDKGQVVGWYEAEEEGVYYSRGFVYDAASQVRREFTLGGHFTIAYYINEKGQTAGYGSNDDGYTRAFRYDFASDTVLDLGALGTGKDSYGYYVNDLGQVAGYAPSSTSGGWRAFVTELIPELTVSMVAPRAGRAVAVGTTVFFKGLYSAPGNIGDTYATWTLDSLLGVDESLLSQINGSNVEGTAYLIRKMQTPGFYDISLDVNAGGTEASTREINGQRAYIAVVDPKASVDGVGWLNLAAGAIKEHPSASGRMDFSLHARYEEGSLIPNVAIDLKYLKGGVRAQFRARQANYVVISGQTAIIEGTGSYNFNWGYGYRIWAVDGSPERMRVRIWNKANGQVVFDSEADWPDDYPFVFPIGGGNIAVHH